MVEALKPVGKLQTLAREIINYYRGYSPEDVISQKKLLNGDITPEDRKRFIQDESARLGSMYFGSSTHIGSFELVPPAPHLGIVGFQKGISRIQHLPPHEVDSKIRDQARDQLKSWGKL